MEAVVAHIFSEAQAEAVLAELRPYLRDRPPIDQFREQLDVTIEPIWAIHRVASHYRTVGRALRKVGLSVQPAKTAQWAMEESSALPEMLNYTDLLKLNEVRAARLLVNERNGVWPGFRQVFPDNKSQVRVERRATGTPASFAILQKLRTNSASDRRSAAAVELTTRTRPPSPDLYSPLKSRCPARRDRTRWLPSQSRLSGRSTPPLMRLALNRRLQPPLTGLAKGSRARGSLKPPTAVFPTNSVSSCRVADGPFRAYAGDGHMPSSSLETLYDGPLRSRDQSRHCRCR